MLTIVRHGKFKKDVKRLSKSVAFAMDDLKKVIIHLESENQLDSQKHRPHKLIGEWQGYMECHVKSISSDWVLIYSVDEKQKILKLARTGTHAELFG